MRNFWRKKLLIAGLISCIALGGAEVLLRSFGFCDAVLMREDPDYEYIAQPNQERHRFGNRVFYNSFSMRSAEVSADTNALKILGFGDSVLNGGVLTDKDSLATTLLSDALSKKYGKKVQFLNIGTAGWGTDNFYAYLQKHGHFGAKHIFLFLNGNQAYYKLRFNKVVGVDENFPKKQSKLALLELWKRYLFPPISFKIRSFLQKKQAEATISTPSPQPFSKGFDSLLIYAKSHKLKLSIYLHANKTELEEGKYNEKSQKIIDFAQKNDIRLIKELENGLKETDFRDEIHLSETGQKHLAEIVLKYGIE